MNLTQRRLKACPNVQTLATELVATCTRFGAIRYLKVLVANYRGQLQALCFWQMCDVVSEEQVMVLLHAQRVSNYLVLVTSMPQPNSGTHLVYPMPSRVWV